jgi:hypothetical protein
MTLLLRFLKSNPSDFCMVCGKPVSNLNPFTKDDIIDLDLQYPIHLYGQSPDGKLGVTFRGVNYLSEQNDELYIERQVGKSWECFGCLTSDPDKVEAILAGNPALVGNPDEVERCLREERSKVQLGNAGEKQASSKILVT